MSESISPPSSDSIRSSVSFSSDLPLEPPSTLSSKRKQGTRPSLTSLATLYFDIDTLSFPPEEQIDMLCRGDRSCSTSAYLLFALTPYALFKTKNM